MTQKSRAPREFDQETAAVAEHVFRTPWGWMAAAASAEGLCSIVLPQPAQTDARARLRESTRRRPRGRADGRRRRLLAAAEQQLRRFLDGDGPAPRLPLDLRGASPFQRKVWQAIGAIPYGELRSYKWVAARVGGGRYARAVGHALGANPLPIVIPCHRIVTHDGKLGGFTGGLPTKRRLLELEGSLREIERRSVRTRGRTPSAVSRPQHGVA